MEEYMKIKKVSDISFAKNALQSTAICIFLMVAPTAFGASTTPVQIEINNLLQKVSGLQVIAIPASGTVLVTSNQSLTVDMLRNITLDDNPPVLTQTPNYPANQGDGAAEGSEPYIAQQIMPFRLNYFTNEWNYGGYYSWAMADYALQHGFNINHLDSNRDPLSVPVSSSEFLSSDDPNLNTWMTTHGYSYWRLDQLPAEVTLTNQMLSDNLFPGRSGVIHYMLDLESPTTPLSVTNLRAQGWYPSGGVVNAAFEDAYYAGFVNLESAAASAAKAQGWQTVGIYGWQPYPNDWYGTEKKTTIDPSTDEAWNRYGKAIYSDSVLNVIYPSVYTYYWNVRNVAFTLAVTDFNMMLVKSASQSKPVRPYFWNLLHGGGSGWRWWRNQPIKNEDLRAMAAMNFYTGDQGMVLWGWTGFASLAGLHGTQTASENAHTVVVKSCTDTVDPNGNYSHGNDADYSVKNSFTVQSESGQTKTLERYYTIEVLEITADNVARFQVITMQGNNNYSVDRRPYYGDANNPGTITDYLCWQSGDTITQPVYRMDATQLASYLRPNSESVTGVVEGLALVKTLEYTLSHGIPIADVSSQSEFMSADPIVRRVKKGRYNIIATYDPQWQSYPQWRQIALNNFDGQNGLALSLPADKQTRFFITEEPAATQSITVTTSPPSSAIYNSTFLVAATATSGLPVSINSGGGCSGSGTGNAIIKMTSGSTSCKVTYDQAGDDTYGGSPQVTSSIAATKANQSITVTKAAPSSAGYGNKFTVTALANSGLVVAVTVQGGCALSGDTVTMSTMASAACTVTYSQAGNSSYQAAANVSTVTKFNQTITTGSVPGNKKYGDVFSVTASASVAPVAVSTADGCSNSGNTITMTSGTTACTLNFDQAGNGVYAQASRVSKTVTTTKASQLITFPTQSPSSQTFVLNNTFLVSPLAAVSSHLPIIYTSVTTNTCSVAGTTVTMKAKGTCKIAATQGGDSNYSAATSQIQAVTLQ
jgi:hypothetical protein